MALVFFSSDYYESVKNGTSEEAEKALLREEYSLLKNVRKFVLDFGKGSVDRNDLAHPFQR